jgi:hypothetical protein
MRTAILALAMVVGVVGSAQAQAPSYPLGAPLVAHWNASPDEVTSSIQRYELRLDAGNFTAAGQAMPRAEYSQPLVQTALTVGQHVISVRACNAAGCGVETPFVFHVVQPVPGAVPGVGVRPGPALAINFNSAQDYARSWAYLVIDRYPTKQEMDGLVVRHGGAPLTKEAVIATMTAAYTELVARR